MNALFKALGWLALGSAMTEFAAPRLAAAQETPPPASTVAQPSHSTAQAEAGEPRADTSAASPMPPASMPGASMPAGAPAGAAGASPQGARKQGVSQAGRAAGPPPKPTAADRLELGTATVTGDREQPKVMYIVPWKKSDIGDLSGKPMNSLLDEALSPVDRDEFKREVVYYQAVKADASQNGASKPPAKQGEK
jgi:hypothetical protein